MHFVLTTHAEKNSKTYKILVIAVSFQTISGEANKILWKREDVYELGLKNM